jgi:rSAM/selenodomain-associated transferase 2
MRLSIIIPTWNEAEVLGATLDSLPKEAEVVLADGGSVDGTIDIARRRGARVVHCERGRARQMNRGAGEATGDTLLFLHADGVLGEKAAEAIDVALRDPSVAAASFRLRIRNPGAALSLVVLVSNARARYLGMPYGDQGLAIRRSTFEELEGFPEIPFLEDVAFVRKLKRKGRPLQLDSFIETGDRHWRELGVLATTLLNWTMVALYLSGVSAERLAPHYFGRRSSQNSVPAAQPD